MMIADRLEPILAGLDQVGFSTLSRDECRAQLGRAIRNIEPVSHASQIDRAITLLESPCALPTDVSAGFRSTFAEVGAAHRLALILRVDAYRCLLEASPVEAARRLASVIRLADYMATNQSVIIKLGALDSLDIALRAIEDDISSFDARSSDVLLDALRAVSPSDPLRAGAVFTGERELMLDSLTNNKLLPPQDQASPYERDAAAQELGPVLERIQEAWYEPDPRPVIVSEMASLRTPFAQQLCPRYDRYYDAAAATGARIARVRALLESVR